MKRNADESPPWTRSNARAHTHADAVSRGAESIYPAVSDEAVRRILRKSPPGVANWLIAPLDFLEHGITSCCATV